jgi:hypothetical protein
MNINLFVLNVNNNLIDDDEHEWITKTCRKGWDENIEYKENYKTFSFTNMPTI